jgi:small GTP-binding protein
MGEGPQKQQISAGLLAHVDAGKTTLSEALLYESGARRTWGRVDHKDAYLDTHSLERARGITIFSKQALFSTENLAFTLLDTPGHVDFSAETERVMPVLDCAVLVISGTDGVQAHTVTLWNLLKKYNIPVFLFVNKMDLPGVSKEAIMTQLRTQLSQNCVAMDENFLEESAMCDEALMETYLETGEISQGNLRGLVEHRKLFPCCFGSALKLEGVGELLQALDQLAPRKEYGTDFAAQVFKITRDPQNNRLTWLKVTGGSLKVRSVLRYVNREGTAMEEKAVQLRLYSGEKFTPLEEALPGQVVAVTGLTETWAGMGLGEQGHAQEMSTEPVMTYRVQLPAGKDAAVVVPKLRQLEEEDPQLHLLCDGDKIHIQIMGKVQAEIFKSVAKSRFDLDLTLADPRIYYKETIENTVEGVGHFEPLRHYAEVHLLLSPLPRGTGLVFDSTCHQDVLDVNWQRLIMGHLSEKTHKGVLVGAPITDMKITLAAGRAHLKHTEGGDFRQATYRAVRQGLMQAKSTLLEPWYRFTLTLPTEAVGRAITDVRAMGGDFDAPDSEGSVSVLKGMLPAAELGTMPIPWRPTPREEANCSWLWRAITPATTKMKWWKRLLISRKGTWKIPRILFSAPMVPDLR